ncbi:MAG: NADH-quinone oxidoreductase subunit J [Deinococcales bacterium]
MLGFIILAALMIIGAIGVVSLKEPVHAALSLVGTLLSLAICYVSLNAHFLASVQVIVYAGAIMVLFLFVIMLLNVTPEDTPSLAWIRPAAYVLALVAAGVFVVAISREALPLPEASVIAQNLKGGGAAQIGEILFSDFVLAFQLVGVLLLTGIIGAVSLVQRKAEQVYKKA